MFLIYCVLPSFPKIDVLNLGDVGEPFTYVLEGEAVFETPTMAVFEWGAGDVADHLGD